MTLLTNKGSLAFILLLFLNYHGAAAQFDEDEEVIRGNNFIDKLLHDMLEENGHEYDPYMMEDSRVGFSKKIAFVNVSGEAKLHNGYITGLKTIHRPDNCKVEDQKERLMVKADLGAGVLNFHYDGTVKFMNFGPTISVHGELAYAEIHMEFTVNAKTGRDGKLRKFKIDDMKGLTTTITGLGPMNWALNYLISGVTTVFQGFLRRLLEKKVQHHIAERLPNYQFPVEEGQTVGTIATLPDETECPDTEEPETEAPEPETEAPEPETEAPEPETEAPDTETEAPEPETEAPEPEETDAPVDPEDDVVEELETLEELRALSEVN